jgi:V8-like Glu-specific endopeptidase
MRPRHILALASIACFVLSPFGCAVETAPPEQADRSEHGIIGGTADTTNKAVMWVTNDFGSACSGTMISVNGNFGWVLTAGHCEDMQYVVQANDFDDCFGMGNPGCEAVYNVDTDIPHPLWNGDPSDGYDFRLLRVTGTGASTPVIPASSNPDGVNVGTQIEVVGYGVTGMGNNTLRRHVTETVAELYSSLIIAYQNDGTGSCSGDSGGPALSGGKVVGVTSFGDPGCDEYGGYGRVQLAYNDFIAPNIGAPVEPSCDACIDSALQPSGACGPQTTTCINSQQCQDFIDCASACTTQSCFNNCVSQHQTGADQYFAIVDCYCAACAECMGEPECDTSTSSTVTTGSGPSTSASTGSGQGGSGQGGGSGATTGSGGDDDDNGNSSGDDDDDGGETVTTCTCAAPGAPSRGPTGLLGLGALGLALGALAARRRK